MQIYVFKDEKVAYMNFFLDHNDEVSRLNFGKCFFNAKPELGRLEDYSLYSVADFTVDEGVINVTEPKFVINGLTAYNELVTLINSRNIEVLKGDVVDADSIMEKEIC